jgi:hypothetical protein
MLHIGALRLPLERAFLNDILCEIKPETVFPRELVEGLGPDRGIWIKRHQLSNLIQGINPVLRI